MKIRNFMPLVSLIFPTLPLGLLFLFVWQGHGVVICGMQIFHMLLLFVTYRAGIRSAQKNFKPRLELGNIVYLPLKVNLALYLIIGIPVVFIFSQNVVVLMSAFAASLVGFALAYVSGLTYVVRSAPQS